MKALEQYQTHRKNLENELKEFVKGMNTTTIKHLANKIEHMCISIGSPISVTDMLKSICNNQIKKWGGERATKKLGNATKKDLISENKQNKKIVCGHFRWNYSDAFILTEKEINYIKSFFFSGKDLPPSFDHNNKYETQAVKFLNTHNTNFSIKLLNKSKYFSDDDKERNIYEITISNKKHSFTFTFGQSIIGTEKEETPSIYDVLACLTKYDPGTFEGFCGEFGYDTDGKRAEKTYNAVTNEWNNVKALFTDAEIEELAEIQ